MGATYSFFSAFLYLPSVPIERLQPDNPTPMKPAASAFATLPCSHAGIHVVRAESRHSFARHTHESFGIGLMLHGAQKSASGRGPVEARAGDLITVNPGEVHDGAPLGDAARGWVMLYADPALVASLARDIAGDGPALPFELAHPVLRDNVAARLFSQCLSAMTASAGDASPAASEAALLQLFAHLLQAKPAQECAVPTGLVHAKAWMDDDPTNPHTLDALAHAAGMGRYTFLRSFAKATGLTPHAYLLQRRLHVARSLIARGMPLADVAAHSGFADQSHLNRVFVRSYGMAPGAYARHVGAG